MGSLLRARVLLAVLVGLFALGAQEAHARRRRQVAVPPLPSPNIIVVPATGPIDPAHCSITPTEAAITVNPRNKPYASFARVEVTIRDAQDRPIRNAAIRARFGDTPPGPGPVLVTGFTYRFPFVRFDATDDSGRIVLDLAFEETVNPLPDARVVALSADNVPIGTVTLDVSR